MLAGLTRPNRAERFGDGYNHLTGGSPDQVSSCVCAAFDLRFLAQKINESSQRRASVSTTGIIEKEAIGPWWRPVVEHGFELTICDE